MRSGSQPLPAAWQPDPPIPIRETLPEFVGRRRDQEDLFELPRSDVEWRILWLANQLEAAGQLHAVNLDRGKRMENSQKIWELGCQEDAWELYPTSFAIFTRILYHVGLEIIDPKHLSAF